MAMEESIGYLTDAQNLMLANEESELVALELNATLHAMNSIIGRVGVEDLLDEIFASFCLGK
jgi:tRNA modification GTPase